MVYIRKNRSKQFSWTPDNSDTTGSPTARGGITPLLVSKWLLSATAMIPTPRQLALISPLAICTFPYNKNSGYDSRQGTSKSINTNYLRKRNSADGK
jgi:hypothetical protein